MAAQGSGPPAGALGRSDPRNFLIASSVTAGIWAASFSRDASSIPTTLLPDRSGALPNLGGLQFNLHRIGQGRGGGENQIF